MAYVKFEKLFLKSHPQFDERWVQDRIAEDPSILGLGDVYLKDKERIQPRAGRLDLLLQDAEDYRRYEVEIQLGATDESHIIRTIEYWDIERKRYPQYEHVAVIVAEDITSRFLNVISLFNGTIPLIAIQMSALKSGDQMGLVFTKVMDHIERGLVDEDEEIQETADRPYWEKRASKKTLAIVDELLVMTRKYEPAYDLKFNKGRICLARDGRVDTMVVFHPKKEFCTVGIRLSRSTEMDQKIETSQLHLIDYNERWNRYRIRLLPEDVAKNADLLTELLKSAYDEANA
jgi:hypothetical protein